MMKLFMNRTRELIFVYGLLEFISNTDDGAWDGTPPKAYVSWYASTYCSRIRKFDIVLELKGILVHKPCPSLSCRKVANSQFIDRRLKLKQILLSI